MENIIQELEKMATAKTISPDMLIALFSKMSKIEGDVQKLETLLKEFTNLSSNKSRYVTEQGAMELLGIRSKTTLWKLRTEGKIAFTQPSRKIILYDRLSIEKYLEENRHDSF